MENDLGLNVCMEFIKSLEALRDTAKEITPENKDRVIALMDELIAQHAESVQGIFLPR